MSVCVQADEDSGVEEPGAPMRELYETKSVSKVVRVLTVLAYLLSVSLAAILLSVYYVCVWKSPELPALSQAESELSARRGEHSEYHAQGSSGRSGGGGEGELSARRGDPTDYQAQDSSGRSIGGMPDVHSTGGGNTTVNATDAVLVPANTTSLPSSDPPASFTSSAEPSTTPIDLETTNDTTTESSGT